MYKPQKIAPSNMYIQQWNRIQTLIRKNNEVIADKINRNQQQLTHKILELQNELSTLKNEISKLKESTEKLLRGYNESNINR